MLEHLLAKIDLSDEETALLGRLALYLDRGESGHSLLINRHLFDAATRKMRQSEEVPETQLGTLRSKIGFQARQPQEVPASSTVLPEGSPVLLVAGNGTRLRGTLVAQRSSALLVTLDSTSPVPARDVPFTFYFHNAAGIFSFPTRIIDVMEDTVHLEHSAEITYKQRRKYHRRREYLPVFIRPALHAAVAQASFILDLGGGGASLQNPRGLLKEGDLLELSFSPEMGKFTIVARVLRVSKSARVLHVKFDFLSENERNRIMGFLFAQSRRRGIRSRKSRVP